jgi:hypothetical protein
MNYDDEYNELLKYPLFRVAECNPRIVAESKKYVDFPALLDRLYTSITDNLHTSVVDGCNCFLDSVEFTLMPNELELPFHTLVEYKIKPIVKKLNKQLRNKVKTVTVKLKVQQLKIGIQCTVTTFV